MYVQRIPNVVHRDNFTSAQLRNYTTAQLHNCTITQLHNYTTSQLHNFTITQLNNFTTSQLHNYTTSQLHNYTTAQLHNCTTSRLHNCTTSQLHNCTTSQLHNWKTSQLHQTLSSRAADARKWSQDGNKRSQYQGSSLRLLTAGIKFLQGLFVIPGRLAKAASSRKFQQMKRIPPLVETKELRHWSGRQPDNW